MNRLTYVASLAALLAGTATAAGPAVAAPPAPTSTPPCCAGPLPSVDTRSIDAVVAGLYDGVSTDPGERRDRRVFAALFAPDARVHVTHAGEDGRATVESLDVAAFIALNERRLQGRGFHEREIHRERTDYGAVTHLWSVFEARRERDGAPYARGANSIQLLRTPDGWRVLSLSWDLETARTPLDARFPAVAAVPAAAARASAPGPLPGVRR